MKVASLIKEPTQRTVGFVTLLISFIYLVCYFTRTTTISKIIPTLKTSPMVWKKWSTQNKDGCDKFTTSYNHRKSNKEFNAIPYGRYSFENKVSTATIKAFLPTKYEKASSIILAWPRIQDIIQLEEREKADCFPTKMGDCLDAQTCPDLEQSCYFTNSVHFAGSSSVTLISTDVVSTILPKRAKGDLWAQDNSEDTYTYPHMRSKILHDAMNVTLSNMRDLADLWNIYALNLWGPNQYSSNQEVSYESFFRPPTYTFEVKHNKNVAAVLISNERANSYRKEILKELMKHMNIASMGDLFNNVKFPGDKEKKKTGMVSQIVHKVTIISKYKFTFAMHNTIEYDTIDEKVWGPWLVGSVPIVLGPPNIEDYAPGKKSYISISDYKTPEELAEHLKHLSNNKTAYNEYLAWKSEPPRPSFVSLFKYTRPWSCLMCKYHQSVMKGEDKEWLQEEKDEFSKIDASGMRISDAVGVVDDFRITTGVNKCSSTSGWHQDLWNELL